MAPVIYIVRHAEGEHNIENNKTIRDPRLTEKGRIQCANLCSQFPHHDDVDLVLASPLKRTIETAVLAFNPALRKPDVSLVLVPMAQEINEYPCDVGYARKDLEEGLGKLLDKGQETLRHKIILDDVVEDWNSKDGYWAPSPSAIKKRAADLRCWLLARAESTIALVTHGGFAHYLTDDWTGYDVKNGSGYRNCEVRRYKFTRDSCLKEARLEEVEAEQWLGYT